MDFSFYSGDKENGIILYDKPADISSFQAIAKIRNTLNPQKKPRLKIGHAGTLDPFATGLLIVLVGRATKTQDTYMKQDKDYIATLKLNQSSTTGDKEGEITDSNTPVIPTKEQIESALKSQEGTQLQTVPAFSAIHIAGRRAYDLARKGIDFERPKRQVTIHHIELLDYTYPLVTFKTTVSSGTYIRSLAEDIGHALGTNAYLTALRRTRIGDFSLQDHQNS